MYHRNYTTYLQREIDFLKLLVSRFHEQEKVNGLELDVALQKTQDVYEQLLKIKLTPEDGTTATALAEKTISATLSRLEPPKEEQPHRPRTADVAAPEKMTAKAEKKITKTEPLPPAVAEEKIQQAEPAKASILAEKISPSGFQPVNETLAQQKTGSDLSSKLQTAPLASIASGIGLNDKFLYIRELFHGDNELYNNTVRNLDAADSLENALDMINQHFDWDEKDTTAQKFVNLVHRRHGNN